MKGVDYLQNTRKSTCPVKVIFRTSTSVGKYETMSYFMGPSRVNLANDQG